MTERNPLIVIPSQVDENGIPKKQLLDIHGKPMIVHSWSRAIEAGCGNVIVDCVDDQIAEAVGGAGAYVYRTDPDHHLRTHNYRTESGADRVAATVNKFDRFYTHDVIINLHDDLPAIDPKFIRTLLYPLADYEVAIATLVCPLQEGDETNPSVVKATVEWEEGRNVSWIPASKIGRIKDLSRDIANLGPGPYYHHIPIYAYQRPQLDRFVNLEPTDSELNERIEGKRALENGMRMDVALIDEKPLDVDWENEVEKARDLLDKAL
jgi:3-deoxy-manno-octulosonate cytidylyltransferase (CMP-KDO synthetase)